MNKEELLKEFNSKVEDLRQELLEKLKLIDEKNDRFQVALPKEYDTFYYIDDLDNEINLLYFEPFDENDRKRFLTGRLFKTEKEAEQYLKEQELLFKIKKWAEIYNEGWKPDLTNHGQAKWSIVYNIRVDGFIPHNMRVFNYLTNDLPYFKSRKVAQKCIKEFGKEINEVLL